MDCGLTRQMAGKMAEKWRNGPKIRFFEPFSDDFPIFWPFFAPLPGEAKIHFSAILPDFGPKARKQSVAGQRDRSGENNALVKIQGVAPKLDPYRDERGLSIFEILIILAVLQQKTPNQFKRAGFCNCNGCLNPQEIGPVTVIGYRHSSMLWESQLVQ